LNASSSSSNFLLWKISENDSLDKLTEWDVEDSTTDRKQPSETLSAEEPGSGTVSLQEQLHSLQEAIQVAVQAWNTMTAEGDIRVALADAKSRHMSIKGEADSLLQRAVAAEEVRMAKHLHTLDQSVEVASTL
jgi:hypothetical protein